MHTETEQLRLQLLDKVRDCVSGKISHRDLLKFAATLNNNAASCKDFSLCQSIGVLNFLAKQVAIGNSDLLTRELIQESYVFVMEQLTPNIPEAHI